MSRIRIGLDAMGGDYAPTEAIKGAFKAAGQSDFANVDIVLVGEKKAIEDSLAFLEITHPFEIIDAPDTISMSEHPTKAVSAKRNSSIMVGLKMLMEGKLDGFASAGNTGAMMVGSLYTVRTIDGIFRPAISTILPRPSGKHGVMLDVGANADVKPDVLVQFANIGAIYAKSIMGIENPTVGLLSIGEEKEKGNILTQATYPLLEDDRYINFIGNVEGRDLFTDKADVVVCDGYTGNVVLKACEGMCYQLMKRGVKDDYLNQFNFENYGGSPILGVNKPVIIGHGISKAKTFVNMLKLTQDVIVSNLIDSIKAQL
ncbi:MAG: phosphate acyltransferase PlsX [Bacteroidia bacterium]